MKRETKDQKISRLERVERQSIFAFALLGIMAHHDCTEIMRRRILNDALALALSDEDPKRLPTWKDYH